MPSFPASGGALNSAWLANEVYVSPGGSNGSNGKAGSPKRTIYDGLEKLISLGGGTLNCDSQSDVGGPVSGQGIWLRCDFLPSSGYFFDAPGFLPLTVPIRIAGRGKDGPAGPFTIAPTTDYNGGGSSQFKPALWLVGCPIPNTAFEMVNMQSSWLHQAIIGTIPPELRAGKLGARVYVDFDRELNGDVKQISVTNATRTGTSTVLTVDVDAVTPVTVASGQRAAGVVTLTITNPGYPFAPWTKRGKIKLVSADSDFPAGSKTLTAINNWAAGNATWTVTYAEAGADVLPKALTGVTIKSHGCCEGELLWLTSTNVHFASQQYYVSSVTDSTVTVFDNFGDGNSNQNNIGSIAHQERRRVSLINTRFERCSQGIDSSFSPVGATHSWDIGSNLAVLPELINCWGEGSVSGGGLPNYDWRNFSAYFGYGGSGGGEDDGGSSVVLQRFMCNNGGIYAEASPFGATTRLVSSSCLVEQASFSSDLPGILFKGNTFSSVYIADFLNADGDPDKYAVEIQNTPMSAAVVQRSGRVKGAVVGGDNWLVPSAWGSGSTFKNPWTESQFYVWADGRITGKHPGAARAMGPVAARYRNIVENAVDWTFDAGVTVTPGGGEPGTDGLPSDLIETTTVSNITITDNSTHGTVVAEGGKIVFTCWINSNVSLRDGLCSISSNQFTVSPMGPGYSGTGWQVVQGVSRVGAVSASPPNYFANITLPAGATVSVRDITITYVPDDVDDNDAYEYAGTIKPQPNYLPVGTCGIPAGQKFCADGGLMTNSANAKTAGVGSGQLTLTGTGTVYLPEYGRDGTTVIGWKAMLQATINP